MYKACAELKLLLAPAQSIELESHFKEAGDSFYLAQNHGPAYT